MYASKQHRSQAHGTLNIKVKNIETADNLK